MKDGPVRRLVKSVALAAFRVDVAVDRAIRRARGERPWLLRGDCGTCAACCEAPGIAVGRFLWSVRAARSLFLAWQRIVNGFEFVSADPRGRMLVFRCTHFDRETRRCDSYESRPGMCRDYPRLLLWQPNPELLPACRYRAVPPNADGLAASLDQLDLSPEQRRKLRDGLRLGD